MANLLYINKKIKTVKVTSRITYALEIISTTQSHVYKELQNKTISYVRGIHKLFYEVFSNPEHDIKETNKRLFSYENGKNELWLVLGTDIGMCGDINDKLAKYVYKHLDFNGDSLVVLGNKLFNSLGSELIQKVILKEKSELVCSKAAQSITELSQKIFQTFMSGNYRKLTFLYMKDPKLGIMEKINVLPFTENYFPAKKKVFVKQFEFKSKYPNVIIELFPQYLECVIFSAIIGSKLVEHTIRRDLMHSATKNANELLDEYTLLFNKVRQANITQEICEAVVASQFKRKG